MYSTEGNIPFHLVKYVSKQYMNTIPCYQNRTILCIKITFLLSVQDFHISFYLLLHKALVPFRIRRHNI